MVWWTVQTATVCYGFGGYNLSVVKQSTTTKLNELVKKYPGDKAEAKKFVDWCKGYDPAKELLKAPNAVIDQFTDRWVRLCLMQIEHRKKKEAEEKGK